MDNALAGWQSSAISTQRNQMLKRRREFTKQLKKVVRVTIPTSKAVMRDSVTARLHAHRHHLADVASDGRAPESSRPDGALIQLFAEISNQHCTCLRSSSLRCASTGVVSSSATHPATAHATVPTATLPEFHFVVANQFIKHPAHIGHMCGRTPVNCGQSAKSIAHASRAR